MSLIPVVPIIYAFQVCSMPSPAKPLMLISSHLKWYVTVLESGAMNACKRCCGHCGLHAYCKGAEHNCIGPTCMLR
jgi:hypothetical protein